MSEEDIFVVHKQMETAYFNSKSRELGLPIWKDEEMTDVIYDLMVGHEIGHALWTPLDMLENAQIRKIDHGFVNILEDVRIEKFGKRKYPGLVNVMNRGYSELAAKDFFGTKSKDINSLNLIDRINLFFKGQSGVEFSDEEKIWVNRAVMTETPDEVLDLAEELYAWMEENESETDNHDSGDAGSSMEMPSDENEGNDGKSSGNSDVKSDDADDGKSDETSDNDGSAGNGDAGDEDKSENGGTGSGSDIEDKVEDKPTEASTEGGTEGGKNSTGKSGPPVAETDSASKNGLDALRDKTARERTYARIPKVNLKDIVVDTDVLLEKWNSHYLNEKGSDNQKGLYFYKTLEEVEALKSDSKSTVAYMVKEFEMKKAADQYARAATSKTGSLDMGKLHTYKYNEDLFKKVTTLPGATNHGMVMALDWAGSMAGNLKGTLAQMYNLIWFCRRAQIPFEVYAFSDNYLGRNYKYNPIIESDAFKAGDLVLNNGFKMLNMFSSNMSLTDEMTMMHILWMYASRWGQYRDWSEAGYPYNAPRSLDLGGTPLNDAIIAMMDIVPQFKRDTGVQKVNTIFLTDGASNRVTGIYDYKLVTETGEHHRVVSDAFGYSSAKTIITDPVMNKNYESTYSDCTNDLLKILKNRVSGMNIVGFFIAGNGKSGRVDKRTLYYLLGTYDNAIISEKIKFINKNKYLAITQLGYDEYYVLPGGNALAVENETLSDDLIGAGKGKLKTAFGKMAKGKISSRQLLNKFVSLVA